jgi:hypothetical protein
MLLIRDIAFKTPLSTQFRQNGLNFDRIVLGRSHDLEGPLEVYCGHRRMFSSLRRLRTNTDEKYHFNGSVQGGVGGFAFFWDFPLPL